MNKNKDNMLQRDIGVKLLKGACVHTLEHSLNHNVQQFEPEIGVGQIKKPVDQNIQNFL